MSLYRISELGRGCLESPELVITLVIVLFDWVKDITLTELTVPFPRPSKPAA